MNLATILLSTDSNWISVATLFVRIAIGLCFVAHGLGKLGIVGAGNMKQFEGWLASMKIPFPAIQARMAMLSELVGGLLIASGFVMRAGCILCIITMLVASFIGHKGGRYLITNTPQGNEYPLNLAVICLLLFVLGPGIYSLDWYLFS